MAKGSIGLKTMTKDRAEDSKTRIGQRGSLILNSISVITDAKFKRLIINRTEKKSIVLVC